MFDVKIELSTDFGCTITVINPEGPILQTIKMDGLAIITTVDGPEGVSTITQTPIGVNIVCSEFTVTADTINMESTAETSMTAGAEYAVDAVGDVSVASEAAMTVEAVAELAVSAASITVEAELALEISATTLTVEAEAEATLSSAAVTIIAEAEFTASGGASAMVQSEGVLTLDGSVTSVIGEAVNIDGAITMIM